MNRDWIIKVLKIKKEKVFMKKRESISITRKRTDGSLMKKIVPIRDERYQILTPSKRLLP